MKKIVTIGGGTGSFTVLSGIKNISNISISAIVSMADDGGSTGVLRDELGVLPSGDIRQCLVALSEHSETLRKLMNYRFTEGGLMGHNFGNIFLAALEKVTGSFVKGILIVSEILKVSGVVIPVTNNKAELSILLKNGKIIEGENKINHSDLEDKGIKKIYYKHPVKLNINAEKAILEADFIIIGPGNYYCSLLPNLIVKGFKKTIRKSKAKIILPINLTNKNGHTTYWKVSDYVKNIEKYLNKKVDFILVNNQAPSTQQIRFYKLEEGDGVIVKDDLNDSRVIREPLLSRFFIKYDKADTLQGIRSFIRHDSKKLATCIHNIII